MATERYRTPMRVPALALVRSPMGEGASSTTADLFGIQVVQSAPPEIHPDFATRAAIWRDQAAGLISFAEAQRRSASVGQVLVAKPCQFGRVSGQLAAKPPRHSRPAPNASRQYAGEMATTAARDDRLTPNAKAFLQVLRARCGKGRVTEFAKQTMASVMSRSARTIARYLRDLERFGYIATEIRRTGRGFHTGLVVTLTEKVLPFYEEAKGLASWLAETPKMLDTVFVGRVLGKQGVTKLSLKNQTSIFSPFRFSKAAKNGHGGADQRPPGIVQV